jgi:hypothetical protein
MHQSQATVGLRFLLTHLRLVLLKAESDALGI